MPGNWPAYEFQPSFVLGFHGCDKEVGQAIIRGNADGSVKHLHKSEKKYDWLGHGVYFWEGNPARALQWAHQRKDEGTIQEPFVVGAILDLRHCLDLFDQNCLKLVNEAHAELEKTSAKANVKMAKNVGKTPDKAGRALDCAVMNYLHTYCEEQKHKPFDSIRGPFLEGDPLYEGAGFRSESHIQICVRSMDCIKGYFLPITDRA